MNTFKYLFGPVPSRRMGISLGISPIPEGFCNYSCIYCQLGKTNNMTNERQKFFPVSEIIDEFKVWLTTKKEVDVITIVGEGEPTLYKNLGHLLNELKILTKIPIAVITNGSLFYLEEVRKDLQYADIVLPSFDVSNKDDFFKVNRPHGKINYSDVYNGLKLFSHEFKGQLWIEIMLVKGYNDSEKQLIALKDALKQIDYDRIFINTPVRPPAEAYAIEPSSKTIELATKILGGVAINHLISTGFSSDIISDYEAIESIIKRHPMNQFEIKSFLEARLCKNIDEIFNKLSQDNKIEIIEYKGYKTYRK